MISPMQLPPSPSDEYCCRESLDLYDAPNCQTLATQMGKGRHLEILSSEPISEAIAVRSCEDGYLAWLPVDRIAFLEPAASPYQAIALSRDAIESRIPEIIAFTKGAMARPNFYLWGGNLGPNYDCSGLIQAAFAASGIWLPRDSYQQADFTQKVSLEELIAGDLIFFGTEKVNHVALYLGEGNYIHSSGKEMGRDGIAIDPLSDTGDAVSQSYYQKLWGFGRVMSSYSNK